MPDAAKPKVLPNPIATSTGYSNFSTAQSKRRSSRFGNSWRPLWSRNQQILAEDAFPFELLPGIRDLGSAV